MHALSFIYEWILEQFTQVYICNLFLITIERCGCCRITFKVIVVRKIAHISTNLLVFLLFKSFVSLLLKIAFNNVMILRLFLFLRGRRIHLCIRLYLSFEVGIFFFGMICSHALFLVVFAERLLGAVRANIDFLMWKIGLGFR